MPKFRYTVRCRDEACGWKGRRRDAGECACYEDWARYCNPETPGPGCPRGIGGCRLCGGELRIVRRRKKRTVPLPSWVV